MWAHHSFLVSRIRWVPWVQVVANSLFSLTRIKFIKQDGDNVFVFPPPPFPLVQWPSVVILFFISREKWVQRASFVFVVLSSQLESDEISSYHSIVSISKWMSLLLASFYSALKEHSCQYCIVISVEELLPHHYRNISYWIPGFNWQMILRLYLASSNASMPPSQHPGSCSRILSFGSHPPPRCATH